MLMLEIFDLMYQIIKSGGEVDEQLGVKHNTVFWQY